MNKDNEGITDLTNALRLGTTLDAKERICTTNECNIPTINGHPRNIVRLNKLWHRATYIVVRHEPSTLLEATEATASTEQKRFMEKTRLLVQRRSSLKDYCPLKLDPCPGGLVGFGESCDDNAQRELLEEMGITIEWVGADTKKSVLNTDDRGGTSKHVMKRLFTFPYESEELKCWGEFYEVIYTGELKHVVIQTEEIQELLSLSISDILQSSQTNPKEWMPDGLHALCLYRQYTRDQETNSRCHSNPTSRYQLRLKPLALFFDCDDCLYFDNWTIVNALIERVEQVCIGRGLKPGEAYELYKEYGTVLKGMIAKGYLEDTDQAKGDYLEAVHDIPIHDYLSTDLKLRKLLCSMDPTIPKYVFTAGVKSHAERCLTALGIQDLFVGIIDVKACGYESKNSRAAFKTAMRVSSVEDPRRCVFFDDCVKNLKTANEMGWRGILVGRKNRYTGEVIVCEDAENDVNCIHDIPLVFPELFKQHTMDE